MAFSTLLLLTAVTIATVNSLPYHSETVIAQFKEFVKKHDRNYENEIEEAFRFGIFLKNLDFIDHLNKHSNNAKFGITKFADKTNEEIIIWNTGSMDPHSEMGCRLITPLGDINRTEYHFRFDWRSKGVVTPVRNQGHCESSWAFSTIGNLESIYAIGTGILTTLSPQQLLDCVTYSFGCNGAYLTPAFRYLKNKFSMSESDYPYVGHTQSCRYDEFKIVVGMTDCYVLAIPEFMYEYFVQKNGPISILIDSTILINYSGGIIDTNNCHGIEVNHAALIVGYDQEDDLDYWIIKNSWGKEWGEEGYFRIQRGVNCLLVGDFTPMTAYLM